MSWRISVYIVAFMLVLSACKIEEAADISIAETSYLVEANQLKDIINKQNIKLVDFRKKELYETEHITGAINIWRTDIEDTTYAYKGMMASKEQLELLFGSLGIEDSDTIIIYDDNGLCDSARLWWLLQNYDFTNVKLLHGGLSDWKANNGEATNEITKVNKTVFKLAENPKMHYYASKEDVLNALENNVVVLDTRTSDEFSGKRQKKGAAKGGRIPKSIHLDWANAVNYEEDKRIKPLEELEALYSKLNIKKNDPIIVYCHSGVRSAHTSFVLTQLLGYKNVKNYDGSWTEWSQFNDLPIEKDSITVIKN